MNERILTAAGEFTPLTIVMVCSSTLWAGTELWALSAAEELAGRGHRVVFVARQPELFTARQSDRVEVRANLRFVRLPLANDADLFSMARLADLLHRENADVVIPTRVRDYWLVGMAAKLADTPELLRLGVRRRIRDGYWRDRLRYGAWPTAVLVNAQSIKTDLAQSAHIDPDRVHVIYNGIHAPGPLDAQQRMAIRREFGVADNEVLIAGAGRLAAEKRWDWWLEAVAAARDAGVAVRGVLLGNGYERATLEAKRRELKLEEVVTIPGSRPDAAVVLGAADLVVMTSRLEGVSNAMLEALGRAVPVVATSAGGAGERLENGRDLRLVDVDDKPGLIEAVIALAQNDKQRTELGRAGYEAVTRHFAWQRSGDELEALLRQLAERGRG